MTILNNESPQAVVERLRLWCQMSEPSRLVKYSSVHEVLSDALAVVQILEPIVEIAARINMLLAEEDPDVGDMCETEDELAEALKPWRALQCAK